MKKMNRKFIAGTAFAVSAAAAFTACGMPAPAVYGPAPSATVETAEETTTVETTTEETTVEKTTEEVTFETRIDPETEIQEAVYGPPEWFEGNGNEPAYDPESEVQEDVYGPPEWFE